MDSILFLLPLTLLLLAVLFGVWSSAQMTRRRTPDTETSPADYGLRFESVSFPSRDGLTLRGWWIPAPNARGTVIFLHGHGGSMDPDVQYAPAFVAAGLNVLMFDFRAHGRSEGQRVSLGYFERQDALGAVDFCRARGWPEVGLLGFSMGGVVAMITAPQCPEVRAVVSDGGFASLESAIVGWAVEKGAPRWLARWLAWITIAGASLRLGVNLRRADPLRSVGKISPRPILFVHGQRDPYVPPAEFERLVSAAGEPKQIWQVPEAGHREADRRHPEEYRRRVVEFLLAHLPPAAEAQLRANR